MVSLTLSRSTPSTNIYFDYYEIQSTLTLSNLTVRLTQRITYVILRTRDNIDKVIDAFIMLKWGGVAIKEKERGDFVLIAMKW